ncbi:response regulator [Sphingomonas sp. CJ20]
MENALILIVEDEPEIAGILRSFLERDGFRTVTAEDGAVAMTHHRSLRPDLVLLDIGLPKRDGFAVLSDLRRDGETPVIMTTARAEDLDKLSALRIGADDYVVKPFNPLEIVARVKAVLRRTRGQGGRHAMLRFGALEVDTAGYSAAVLNGSALIQLDLTPTEYRLLAHLVRAPRTAYSRADLVDACLPEGNALERTVDSHISNLRRKLEQAGMPGLCAVVRGVGYRLAAS